ncbi:MAG: hypothetical protein AAF664_16265 [Planctomycetota bacterium]
MWWLQTKTPSNQPALGAPKNPRNRGPKSRFVDSLDPSQIEANLWLGVQSEQWHWAASVESSESREKLAKGDADQLREDLHQLECKLRQTLEAEHEARELCETLAGDKKVIEFQSQESERELLNAKDQTVELQTQLSELSENNSRLVGQVCDLAAMAEQLDKQKQSLAAELNRSESDLESSKERERALTQSVERLRTEWQKKHKQHSERHRVSAVRSERLGEEISSLQISLEQRFHEGDLRTRQANDEIATLQAQLDEKLNLVVTLEQNLDASKSDVKRLNEELVESRLQTLAAHREAETWSNALDRQQQEAEHQYQSLLSEQQELRQIYSLQQAEQEDVLRTLDEQIATLRTDNMGLAETTKEQWQAVAEIRQVNERLLGSNEKLCFEQIKLRFAFQQVKTTHQESEAKHHDLVADHHRLQEKFQVLLHAKEEAVGQCDELKAKLDLQCDKAKLDVDEIAGRMAELESEFAHRDRQASDLGSEVIELEKQLLASEAAQRQRGEEVESLMNQVRESDQTIGRLKAQIAAGTARGKLLIDLNEGRLKVARDRIIQLNTDRQTIASLIAELESIRNEVKDCREALGQLNSPRDFKRAA